MVLEPFFRAAVAGQLAKIVHILHVDIDLFSRQQLCSVKWSAIFDLLVCSTYEWSDGWLDFTRSRVLARQQVNSSVLAQSPCGASMSVLKNSLRTFPHLTEIETFSRLEMICRSSSSVLFHRSSISLFLLKQSNTLLISIIIRCIDSFLVVLIVFLLIFWAQNVSHLGRCKQMSTEKHLRQQNAMGIIAGQVPIQYDKTGG